MNQQVTVSVREARHGRFAWSVWIGGEIVAFEVGFLSWDTAAVSAERWLARFDQAVEDARQ